MLIFVQGDILQTKCDALLHTVPGDWPERIQTILPPSLLGFRRILDDQRRDPDRNRAVPAWGPGRLYPQQGPRKRIIHANIGMPPEYGTIRQCLYGLRDHYPKLGIKSIAMPKIGSFSELQWMVIRNMLSICFSEPNPGTGIYVEVYEVDVPGREHS